jgi:hypothetical protein
MPGSVAPANIPTTARAEFTHTFPIPETLATLADMLRSAHGAGGVIVAGFAIFLGCPLPSFAACTIIGGRALGDCAGVTVNTASHASPSIAGSVSESGMIAGARIRNGGSYHLTGMSTETIFVENGGTLDLSGIAPTVVVDGGLARISGSVNALIVRSGSAYLSGTIASVSGAGKVTVEIGALVAGRVRQACVAKASEVSDCPSLD